MDDALADWLSLREPHDWRARDTSVVEAVVSALPPVSPVRILELGTGTGSNLRYLMLRLPPRQDWLLIDKSPDVLPSVVACTADWAASERLHVETRDDGFVVRGDVLECRVRVRQQDLDLPLDAGLFRDRQLVTASAFLDLASDAWLRQLVSCCRASGAAALFALSYDGRATFEPAEECDDLARDLLNAHQLRDKGLGGPAAGPGGHARAVHWFREAGFAVHEATTDWDVDRSAEEFQRRLIAGFAEAAVEQQPDAGATVAAWRARRIQHVDDGRARVVVGHADLAAWPGSR